MNETLALDMRKHLRNIIEKYEAFLNDTIKGDGIEGGAIVATEAIVARDLVRTISVSEVSKKRSDRFITDPDPGEEDTPSDVPI